MTTRPRHVLEHHPPAEIDRNGLTVLTPTQCLQLLSTRTLGRIALTSGALPLILPVNFCFDGTRILVHTGPGTKLAAATRETVVAFEVDDIDPIAHTGWSVLATGIARHVTDPADLARIAELPLARWAPRGGGHIVSVVPELVSGRRIERTHS